MRFKEFQKKFKPSMDDICAEILNDDSNSIQIKNQRIGIKKLEIIINTAIALANKKGFHAMTLRELCRESGLSMGGLYGYISSKDELLKVIQDQGRRMLTMIMETYLDPDEAPEKQLEQALYIHLYLSEMMQPWFFFSYMESRFFGKEEQNKAIETELITEKIFTDILEKGRLKGGLKVSDPMMTAAVIKAMLQEWYLKRWKYARRDISVEDYAAFIIKWVMGLVKDADLSDQTRRTEDR